MSNDAASDAVDFSGLKKKSKKTSSSSTAVPATDASPAATDDALDFSDLKKKKRKKTVRLDLSDDEQDSTELKSRVDAFGNEIIEEAPVAPTATASATATTDENGAAVTGGDEFADLKKKKRSGKKTNFDLEAFEAELAASSVDPASSNATSNDGTPAGSDGEDNGENDVGEGEDPFKISKDNGEEGDDVVLSKAEQAAEDKDWLKEGQTTRDYAYTELLGRFYSLLYASHPSLSATGVKKRYTLAPPSMHREGNKRSVFANVSDICKKMHRSPEHVIQFLFAELGTNGSVDGSGRLVIKGRFMQKQIENVLRRYIVEYVSCKTCKSPDTLLTKDNRLFFMTCESCGSTRSVSAIKSGFQAQTGKRKAVAKP